LALARQLPSDNRRYAGLGFNPRAAFAAFANWLWFTKPAIFRKKPSDVTKNQTQVQAGIRQLLLEGKENGFKILLDLYVKHGYAPIGSAVLHVSN